MAITRAQLTNFTSTTDATSYASASVTPTTGNLITLWVAWTINGTPVAPTVTGCGLTWVHVVTKVLNDSTVNVGGISIFRAMGTASAGAVTVDFGGVTQQSCAGNLSDWSGTDTSGTNGSGAVVQSVTAFEANPLTSSPSATLAALGDAANAAFAACMNHLSTSTITVDGAFTQAGGNTTSDATSSHRSAGEYKINATVCPFTLSVQTAWAEVAIELKAAGTGGGNLAGLNVLAGGNPLCLGVLTNG